MKPSAVFAVVLTLVLSFVLATPARADRADSRVVEAGPEDGFLCCNGRVPFLFHGEKVLTSTGRAGLFRSEARGERWQRSMKGLVAPNSVSGFVGHVCQAPSDPRVVYALAGLEFGLVPFDGLFSSEDFGQTWTRRAAVTTGFGFANCTVDDEDPHTVYVSNVFNADSWKSTDGGRTVEIFPVPACAVGALVLPRHRVLYIDNGPGCRYVSTDGGVSFSALAEPPAVFGGMNVSPDGRAIFISTFDASFNPTGTFRSTDGGASYVPVSGLPNGGELAFDPSNPSRIYATDGLLHVSNDGGLTFALLPASSDPRFFGFVQTLNVDRRGSVYVSTFGGPFRTDDGGRSFRPLLNGFRASSVNDLAFDAEGRLLVGVNNTRGGFQQIHGLNYRPIGDTLPRDSGNANTIVAVAGSPRDANVIIAATLFQGGVFRTEDSGRIWTPVPDMPFFFNTSTRMAFPSRERVYLLSPGGSGPGLYRSDDAGLSFVQLSSLFFGTVAVHPTNPDVIYLGTYSGGGEGLFKSTDGGQTLQSLGQPGLFSALLVDSRNTQVIYAGERFGQVMRSLDGGQTFAPASSGLAGEGVHGLVQDVRGTLFVWLRGGGLFASYDRAASWHPVDTGEALQRSGVEAGRGKLVADPRRPGRVYLSNAGVIRIDAGDHDAGEDDD